MCGDCVPVKKHILIDGKEAEMKKAEAKTRRGEPAQSHHVLLTVL